MALPGKKIVVLRCKLDRGRKARAGKILKRYGLTVGQAVRIFFAKTEVDGALPFERPREAPSLGSKTRKK